MTMIPPQNISKQDRYGGYGGGCGDSYSESCGLMSRLEAYDTCSATCLGSDLVVGPMAEEESRTESVNEAGSSSKDVQDERDEGWLQLGIGGHMTNHDNKVDHDQADPASGRGGLIELDLLPGGSTQQLKSLSLAPIFHVPGFRAPIPSIAAANSYSSLFLQHPGTSSPNYAHHQEINWAFRPLPPTMTADSSSSSLMPQGSYFSHPFQHHAGVDVAGPSLDFRVVDPPRRPHSGIWFMLQASQNQAREPFLPQISKSYLRIKDGRMTVRLLMKYLVNKLRLDSESEIEIRCRGQQLLPFLTLQHVRDNIWSPREAVTLLPNSSTTDHVMVLHYARTA
ncbi:hypothetical protein F0562_034535 [Nyssa sinensis]|uniref:Uncharacterized protein n=1 Tax=Nyssa sinensis TaxID=561372 RepID=A0A5J5AIH0_9ASTE|nr:hypothetical protein F0562_034535 [Nyssa sinensis]